MSLIVVFTSLLIVFIAPSFKRVNAAPKTNCQLRGYTNMPLHVSSVTQIKDVGPTDWALQSLQSLVERFGIVSVYPDQTFRASDFATRGEIAQWIGNLAAMMEYSICESYPHKTAATLRQEIKSLSETVKALKQHT